MNQPCPLSATEDKEEPKNQNRQTGEVHTVNSTVTREGKSGTEGVDGRGYEGTLSRLLIVLRNERSVVPKVLNYPLDKHQKKQCRTPSFTVQTLHFVGLRHSSLGLRRVGLPSVGPRLRRRSSGLVPLTRTPVCGFLLLEFSD